NHSALDNLLSDVSLNFGSYTIGDGYGGIGTTSSATINFEAGVTPPSLSGLEGNNQNYGSVVPAGLSGTFTYALDPSNSTAVLNALTIPSSGTFQNDLVGGGTTSLDEGSYSVIVDIQSNGITIATETISLTAEEDTPSLVLDSFSVTDADNREFSITL